MANSEKEHKSRLDLSVTLGPMTLSNPVITASGTFGYGMEYADYVDLNEIGGLVVKGLTLKPREGHPQIRLAETPCGLLNCIGLQNVGVTEFIRKKLPFLREVQSAVIANINGSSIEEYVEIAKQLENETGINALEINVSCPNVKAGGMAFGTRPDMTEAVTFSVRKVTKLPLIVKLSPNVTDIGELAKAAQNGGADILSLVNTLLGMAIDIYRRAPVLSNITGGLSGPAIKPVALRCVWEAARAVSLPIIGMGGISSGADAVEFLMAGAQAVSIGTATFVDPEAPIRILREMKEFCQSNGIKRISEISRCVRDNYK